VQCPCDRGARQGNARAAWAIDYSLRNRGVWSGLRDSNPRPPAWQASTLQLMATYGWSKLATAQPYIDKFNRTRAAAQGARFLRLPS
jgi:hypothetical protein